MSSSLDRSAGRKQRLEIVYRRGDQFVPSALTKLDYFLRDHNTNDVRHFDPRLYDTLSDLAASIGHPGGQIDIVCGYRTPRTNESLRAHTTGVAKNSLHIQAEAIDLRMPGVDTLKLRRAALLGAASGYSFAALDGAQAPVLLPWFAARAQQRLAKGFERAQSLARDPELQPQVAAFEARNLIAQMLRREQTALRSFAAFTQSTPKELPAALQKQIPYSAGIPAKAKDAATARALVSFLRSQAALDVLKRKGMDVP